MSVYTNAIPDTRAQYAMVPIPGGEFLMGSASGDRFANNDEMPQHRVRIDPFWMGKYEVTWQEYDAFVYDQIGASPTGTNLVRLREDAITRPTLPYTDLSFGMGRKGYPAIAMSQYAASQFCLWLSAKTGHFYRLPTEAEWEYAARAGTTNAWYFGDDETKLSDHAWYEANALDAYQRVGRKPPNPWGLHDMLGNVSEWVLDQYDAHYYETCATKGWTHAPCNLAIRLHPCVVRGGSWRDGTNSVRVASRTVSTPGWNRSDPNLPTSIFWLRDCDFVGFRIVRPLETPKPMDMQRYWNAGGQR